MLRSILTLWLCLSLLFTPFEYSILPSIGSMVHSMLLPLTNWISFQLFNLTIEESYLHSDSIGQYIACILFLILSLLITISLKKFHPYIRKYSSGLLYFFIPLLLLIYGCSKLFQFQFFFPEPNTLHLPIGMASKDLLFWTSMGTSKVFNLFTGAFEILSGILILTKRFRMLGYMIATGIFAHILLLNMAFDISVKLLSFLLLTATLLEFSTYTYEISVLLGRSTSKNEQPTTSISTKGIQPMVLLSIVIIFLEAFYPYVKTGNYTGSSYNSGLVGSYNVVSIETNSHFAKNWKNVHVNSKNVIVVEENSGAFKGFLFNKLDNAVIIKDRNAIVSFKKNGDHMTMIWKEKDLVIKLGLDILNNKELPLYDDSFHLTHESFNQ